MKLGKRLTFPFNQRILVDIVMTLPLGELRGFAPIGMLEGWNSGIMGYGKLDWWINGEIHLDKEN